MSGRKGQAKQRRKQRGGASNAHHDGDFVNDRQSTAGPQGNGREARHGKASGKSSKKAKRRSRRQESDGVDQDAFTNVPWEDLFEGDIGLHLIGILTAFGGLKSRVANSVPWIAIAHFFHEILTYIDTFILASDSVILPIIASLSLLLAMKIYTTVRPQRWLPVVRRQLHYSCIVLLAFSVVLGSIFQMNNATSATCVSLMKLIFATLAIQVVISLYMERSSFFGADLSSLLATYVVVQLGYPAAIFHGSSRLADTQQLISMFLALAFTAGFTKIICATLSAPGSYHRVTLGSSIFTIWQLLVVIMLCRFRYGCLIFHAVCRSTTLLFVDPAAGTVGPQLKLSGEPKFDLLHVLLELLVHALAMQLVWYSVAVIAFAGILWTASRWRIFNALQHLSLRPILGCFCLALCIRIGVFVVHWTLSWLPLYLSCFIYPLVFAFTSTKARWVSILSFRITSAK